LNPPSRSTGDIVAENVGLLATLATRALYAEQPELWQLGEYGRARTLEDFTHHFRALAPMDEFVFEAHVRYCEGLFAARGYPHEWLEDAWRHMALVVGTELPDDAAREVLQVLNGAVRSASEQNVRNVGSADVPGSA